MNNHHNDSRKKGLKITQITRPAAIKNIAERYLDTLTTEERDSHILNWWPLDENNPNFLAISTKLKNLLLNNEEPPKNIESLLADELILVGLKSSYIGVTNDYLAEQLARLGYETYEIQGDIEHLNACPCCEYRTLSTISDYDICELCMWEDDGTAAAESYSHPNHMTLSTAKKQFFEKTENLPLNKWVKAS
ncbi:CPCC family cysteine-rich protein [Pseudomonas alvandae]|uniref:CPCC family cysteine-rich protein n=1 Tax=Pseudomonas canavaninivorans TaxID=2842348 RepID=UPI002B1D81C6|nr:CPCC family cysteine-rich protein [Pseudomonas canavaninivorans]